MSKELKKQKGAFVVGVDFDHRIAEIAKSNMDKFIQGNIEDDAILNECYDHGKFDYILLLHVVEHLIDPWTLLTKIKSLLKENTKIICAIPNIANWSSRVLLFFQGRWEYYDIGIMDRTHLRFFTKNSITNLFKQNGFQIEDTKYLYPIVPLIDKLNFLEKYRSYFSKIIKIVFPATLWAAVLFLIARPEELNN